MRTWLLFFFVFLGACRTDSNVNDSKGPIGDGKEDSGVAIVGEAKPLNHISERGSNGMVVKLQNHLIANKPDLSMQTCNSDIKGKRYCINIKDNVPFSLHKDYLFFIDQTLITKALEKSAEKKIVFTFNDTHSGSLVHWRCWKGAGIANPNAKTVTVEVTQVNTLSYSCTAKEE